MKCQSNLSQTPLWNINLSVGFLPKGKFTLVSSPDQMLSDILIGSVGAAKRSAYYTAPFTCELAVIRHNPDTNPYDRLKMAVNFHDMLMGGDFDNPPDSYIPSGEHFVKLVERACNTKGMHAIYFNEAHRKCLLECAGFSKTTVVAPGQNAVLSSLVKSVALDLTKENGSDDEEDRDSADDCAPLKKVKTERGSVAATKPTSTKGRKSSAGSKIAETNTKANSVTQLKMDGYWKSRAKLGNVLKTIPLADYEEALRKDMNPKVRVGLMRKDKAPFVELLVESILPDINTFHKARSPAVKATSGQPLTEFGGCDFVLRDDWKTKLPSWNQLSRDERISMDNLLGCFHQSRSHDAVSQPRYSSFAVNSSRPQRHNRVIIDVDSSDDSRPRHDCELVKEQLLITTRKSIRSSRVDAEVPPSDTPSAATTIVCLTDTDRGRKDADRKLAGLDIQVSRPNCLQGFAEGVWVRFKRMSTADSNKVCVQLEDGNERRAPLSLFAAVMEAPEESPPDAMQEESPPDADMK
jgi:hypothetical protein